MKPDFPRHVTTAIDALTDTKAIDRAAAHALISIALTLETIEDHLAYIAVKAPCTHPRGFEIAEQMGRTPTRPECAACGAPEPQEQQHWREKWAADIRRADAEQLAELVNAATHEWSGW